MTRVPKLPTLDAADLRVVGIGLVIVILLVLGTLVVAVTAGLALRLFWLAAGV